MTGKKASHEANPEAEEFLGAWPQVLPLEKRSTPFCLAATIAQGFPEPVTILLVDVTV